MIYKWLKKYLSIIFIMATLLSTSHYHKDLQTHEDCQICIIESSLANADLPPALVYITDMYIQSESTICTTLTLTSNKIFSTFNERAPPKNS